MCQYLSTKIEFALKIAKCALFIISAQSYVRTYVGQAKICIKYVGKEISIVGAEECIFPPYDYNFGDYPLSSLKSTIYKYTYIELICNGSHKRLFMKYQYI